MRDEESLQHVSNKRYRAFLLKAGFTTFAEVLSCPPGALVQRTRLSAVEIEQCLELLANHRMPSCSTVSALCQAPQELLKTGDQHLDALLGGGLRPGTITELVGEASAGKSHLAIQFCLRVQLKLSEGGLSGDAAFLSSESAFPSSRLLQLAHHTSTPQALDRIHLASCPTLEDLEHTVSYVLPALLSTTPIRLVVIDSIAAPVRSEYASTSLLQRGKDLSTFGARLKSLAAAHQLVILIINQVSDVFSRGGGGAEGLSYASQAIYFGSDGNKTKQAALGLSWANLVDTRVMLSRRGRDTREIALVFSPFAARGSKRFKIGMGGIECMQEEKEPVIEDDDEDSMWLDVSDVDMLAALDQEATQMNQP